MNGFFYIDNMSKQQFGPFTANELQAKNIRPETMVWCSGMADWTEAKNVKELEFIFNSNVAVPPPVRQNNNQYTTNVNTPGNNSTSAQKPGMYNSNVYGRNDDVRPMPKNWLIEAILVTVCCCMPFGIAGIIYATKVESLYYAGDYEGAVQASKDAKKWTIVGFASTGIFLFLYILFFVIIGIGSVIF